MSLAWLGLVLFYNPFFTYFLMKNGAIGGTRVRLAILIFFLGLSVLSFLVRMASNKIYFRFSMTSICMLLLCTGTVIAAFWGFLRQNDSIYLTMDIFPLVEFFLSYIVTHVGLAGKGRLIVSQKAIRIGACLLGLMALSDLASYYYLSYVDVTYFGALRAYINGTTVNRLMDFILPCFAPFLIYRLVFRRSLLVEKILTAFVLLVTFLSFYRTLYVSVFITFLVFPLLHVFGIQRRELQRSIWTIAFLGASLVCAGIYFSNGSSSFFQLIADRFLSIFTSESVVENSKFNRFEQLGHFSHLADYFPFGLGLGAFVGPDPVAVMFNYFLQIGLLLGAPSLLVFTFLWVITFKRIVSKILEQRSSALGDFYRLLLSILFSIFVILNIFPYMTYFPFLYIFGAIVAMTEFEIVVPNYEKRAFPVRTNRSPLLEQKLSAGEPELAKG